MGHPYALVSHWRDPDGDAAAVEDTDRMKGRWDCAKTE